MMTACTTRIHPFRALRALRGLLECAGRRVSGSTSGTRAGERAYVLNYHAVGTRPQGTGPAGEFLHDVAPEAFRRQLRALRKRFRIVDISELVARTARGEPVGGLACVTFDDGYRSVLENAVPVLDELEVPGTLFLTTALLDGAVLWRDKVRYVLQEKRVERFLAFAVSRDPEFAALDARYFYSDTKRPDRVNSRKVDETLDAFFEEEGIRTDQLSVGLYSTRDMLASLRSSRLRYGSHGRNHYLLSSLSVEEQHSEIAGSREAVEALGRGCSPVFAVPFGGNHTYDCTTLDILREEGYRGVAITGRSRPYDTIRDPLDECCRRGLVPVVRTIAPADGELELP